MVWVATAVKVTVGTGSVAVVVATADGDRLGWFDGDRRLGRRNRWRCGGSGRRVQSRLDGRVGNHGLGNLGAQRIGIHSGGNRRGWLGCASGQQRQQDED